MSGLRIRPGQPIITIEEPVRLRRGQTQAGLPHEVNAVKIIDTLFKGITTPQPLKTEPAGGGKIGAAEAVGTAAETEGTRILADLKAQGYVLSPDEEERIAEFVETTEGKPSEKLQTVKTALDKGLPLSARSLQSIRAALFEPALPPELQRLMTTEEAGSADARVALLKSFAALSAAEEAREPTLGVQQPVSVPPERAVEPGILTDGADGEEPTTVWIMKALAHVAALSESLAVETALEADAARPFPGEAPGRPMPMDRSPVRSPERRRDASETADIPRALNDEPERDEDNSDYPKISEAVLGQVAAALQLQSPTAVTADAPVNQEALVQGMTLLMREVTPRMAAVKTEFEGLRRELATALTTAAAALESSVPQEAAAEKLSQAIERLDKAILKSDIPLYTSMKTEKQLLSWSSELQTARGLISEGREAEAAQIVARITQDVQAIQFQPARFKVIHRALEGALSDTAYQENGGSARIKHQIDRILEPAQTPRQVLEAFKALGLTHEAEVVSALSQTEKKAKEDWQPRENLKEILMRLSEEAQEKQTTVAGAEKTMNSLTGQQLLSRPETKPQGQTLFFSLPMTLANRVEDLKIYVQSRKHQGKVDWENCTFYFAVHTETYGDVGIRFAAARKAVSIQVKCDNQALRDAVAPLVADFKQTMQETGYQIAGISYSPLKEAKASELQPMAAPEPESDGRGLNLKV